MSFLLTWGERGPGPGCVGETHQYGNHILPVIYLRNVSVPGWEYSDSAQAAAAAAEGTCHSLHPPKPPLSAALCHQRQRGISGEPLQGGPTLPRFFPRLWRSLLQAHCSTLWRVWGIWGARTASLPGRNGDFQLWPGTRFAMGSLCYCVVPSQPPSC